MFNLPALRLPHPSLGALLLGLHLLGGAPLQGQDPRPRLEPEGTLSVQVLDEDGPVAGARVQADGVSAVTDEDGLARLSGPAGELRLEVRSLGFLPAVQRIRVEAGKEVRVVIQLRPAPVELDGMVVRSTRTGRRVQDEPLRVEILDREEIEEKMLMTPGDIVMLLNETGGLRVQVTSPSLGAANIRIQGMRGRYTQLLADGLPLYGGQAGAIGLMQIPPVDLGQVEVIKGVASALYGPSALGGVVNLISLRPEEEFSGELLLNTTSRNGQDLTAYLSGPLSGHWSYSVVGGVHRQTRADLDGSGWADLPGYRRGTVRPRLFWEDGEGSSGLLTAGWTTERREGGTLPGRLVSDGSPFPEELDTDRLDLGISAQRPLAGSTLLQLRGSAMVQDHRHRFGEVVEEDRHGTLFGEIALSGTEHPLTWVVGGALQRDTYRSQIFPGFDYTFTVPGLFLQGDLAPTPELTASLSARWDRHSEYGSHLSPRGSVLYRPGPWTFRASVGGGFFGPTPFTEEIEAAGLSRLRPGEGVGAERARTASLDAGRAVGPLEVNGTLFFSRVRDAVQLVPLPSFGIGDPGGVRLENGEGVTRTAGTELLVRYRWEDLSITGSYVLVRATEPDPTEASRRVTPLTPRHTGGLVAMWEDHDRGLLGVEAYYTGRQTLEDDPFREEGRAWVHLGVLGELRRGSLSLFLNAENLLDVRQTRYDPLVRDRRAPDGRWTVDAWAPIEGRVVNGGVRIRIGG